MGIKEQGFTDYIRDYASYADLVNGTIFGGKQVVKPQHLKMVPRKKSVLLNTRKKEQSQKTDSSQIEIGYLERERDVIMLNDRPEERFYLACEAQSSADYNMPVRNFTYDGIEYSDQIKNGGGGSLTPFFHEVLYMGEKRWLSKHNLQEMMEIPQGLEEFRNLLPDYHINFVDIHDQNPELFQTEWKDVFRLMNHSRKSSELRKYIEDNKQELKKLTLRTRQFLAILLDQYEILDDSEVEVKDVCEAWNGAMMMYREEALSEGMEQGIKRTALNMYRRGYSLEDTAAIVEQPLETVSSWYQEFKKQ